MKKLYGNFDKSDWLRTSQMTEDQVPHTIILHGEDGAVAENIADWEATVDVVLHRPRWNMVVASKGSKLIGFVNVIWAPMAALVVHKFAAMGTKRFIQTGYCGGLSKDLRYGEVLIVTSAKGEDGVSTAYAPECSEFFASNALVDKAQTYLTEHAFPFRKGRIVSTSTMFLETSEMIHAWEKQGLIGVDGETATTFAVAKRFGAEAIALLTCSDNLAEGDNFWERPESSDELEDKALSIIQKLALELS